MTHDNDAVLQLSSVAKHFGGLQVVSDLSMVVRPGELVGLIGSNGAGKSTVFNLITSIYKPDGGSISLLRKHIAGAERGHRRRGAAGR